MSKLLVEYSDARAHHENGSSVLEGCVLKSNFVNRNNRYYPREVMESAVSDLQQKIKNGSAFGMLGHSMNPGVEHEKISHVIEFIRRRGDDWHSRVRLIREGAGKIARSILESGGNLGFSSKGVGDVRPHKDGYNVVQPNFKIHSIDLVGDPSTGEFAKQLKESILSENFSINESALALKILRDMDSKLGTNLASQQERLGMSSTWDNLYAGHEGFPSIKELRSAVLSHLERMDDDTFRVLAALIDLQDDGQYADDDEGLSGSKYRYAKVGIKDPIARAVQHKADWQAKTDTIRRNRAMAHLKRVGKFNK